MTAYNSATGQGPSTPIAADLGGQTLVTGVYNSASSLGLTGTLTLDAAGDPNAVFVFQAGSSLTTASGSQVSLINGAQACNVYWQVGSSATLGTGSTFRGTVIALTDITVTTGATVDGRVLARNGAVTLDTNTISRSTCSGPTVASYAANVGAGAQGLVCPWGGEYDGVGLCLGTGANQDDRPVCHPHPHAGRDARRTATPTSTPTPKPTSTPQIPTKPSGGVDSGDHSIG